MLCFCNGELKVKHRWHQCADSDTLVMIQWKCQSCGKVITSDWLVNERDYD